MDAEDWINPWPECDSEKGGYWIGIWTGYRWEYFAGPFGTCGEAEESKESWIKAFGGDRSDVLRIEEYWTE